MRTFLIACLVLGPVVALGWQYAAKKIRDAEKRRPVIEKIRLRINSMPNMPSTPSTPATPMPPKAERDVLNGNT